MGSAAIEPQVTIPELPQVSVHDTGTTPVEQQICLNIYQGIM